MQINNYNFYSKSDLTIGFVAVIKHVFPQNSLYRFRLNFIEMWGLIIQTLVQKRRLTNFTVSGHVYGKDININISICWRPILLVGFIRFEEWVSSKYCGNGGLWGAYAM